jgi:hypothetical protein
MKPLDCDIAKIQLPCLGDDGAGCGMFAVAFHGRSDAQYVLCGKIGGGAHVRYAHPAFGQRAGFVEDEMRHFGQCLQH